MAGTSSWYVWANKFKIWVPPTILPSSPEWQFVTIKLAFVNFNTYKKVFFVFCFNLMHSKLWRTMYVHAVIVSEWPVARTYQDKRFFRCLAHFPCMSDYLCLFNKIILHIRKSHTSWLSAAIVHNNEMSVSTYAADFNHVLMRFSRQQLAFVKSIRHRLYIYN